VVIRMNSRKSRRYTVDHYRLAVMVVGGGGGTDIFFSPESERFENWRIESD